jgi:hypothetical protein
MAPVQVLRWLLLVVQVLLALPITYLCVVALAAMLAHHRLSRRVVAPRLGASPASRPTFAILVPAHDEEVVIGTLLQSLAELAYPRDRFAVHLVADNCTDRTVQIARATGRVRVHERNDTTKRGKGYALDWLMRRLDAEHATYDAYVVLDADSVVEPIFLDAFADQLAGGALALQAHNTVLNVGESPSTVIRWIALTLMNYVRPLGRNALHASSTLTGNGMCLTRALLARHPWQAYGLAEDYQYYLSVVADGIRVRFVPRAVVRSHMPPTFGEMRTQDVRWEAADPSAGSWRNARRLVASGVKHRDLARIEAAAEVLAPPLSLMVAACALSLALSVALLSPLNLLASAWLWVALITYVASALYIVRPPRGAYRALLFAPAFMAWKLWVFVVLRRSKQHTGAWVRTSRSAVRR